MFAFGGIILKTISIDKINLDKKTHFYTGESCEMYKDYSSVYKIFDDPDHPWTIEKINRQLALQAYAKELDNHILLPRRFILSKEDKYSGYITRNIRSANTLFNYDVGKGNNLNTLYHLLYQLCTLLRSLHSRDIILGDFHFENVLVSRRNKVYLIDFDNISIDNFESYTISMVLNIFLKMYNFDYEKLVINEDLDRLSCLLSIMALFFQDDFLNIESERVDYMIKRIPLLREIVNVLDYVVRYKNINNIPYVDEIIGKRKRP